MTGSVRKRSLENAEIQTMTVSILTGSYLIELIDVVIFLPIRLARPKRLSVTSLI